MVDIARLLEWANSGDITEPQVAKQNLGYLGGEQPFDEHHNWLFNKSDRYDNFAVDFINRRQTLPPTLNEATQFSNNLWPVDWVHPYSSFNTYTFGANSIVYLNPGWNSTLNRPCVYAARYGLQSITEIRNANDFTIETEVHAITLANGDERIEAFCCDQFNIYVLASRPADDPRMYAFSTNPWSATPVWSFSIPQIIVNNGRGENNLILADNDWLALPATALTADNYCVYMVRRDGTPGVRTGRGNAPNSAAYRVTKGLCSNGTNLFFAVVNTTPANTLLCSADVSNPANATNGGGAITNKDTNSSHSIESLIHDGYHIHGLNAGGNIFTYDWTQDIVDNVFAFTIQSTTSPQVHSDGPHMVFDGINAWALVEYDGTDDHNGFVVPIRVADTCVDLTSPRTISGPRIFMQPSQPTNAMILDTRLAYSDNCLWLAPRNSAALQNLVIYRIPNLIARY